MINKMTKVEYLRKIRAISTVMNLIFDEIDIIDSKLYDVSDSQCKGIGTSNGRKEPRYVRDLARKDELQRKVEELEELASDFEDRISHLDEKTKIVLRQYYIYFLSQKEIAKRRNVSTKTISRWIKNGLSSLSYPDYVD